MALALATMVAAAPALAQKNPHRNVYFGEQHVHTNWSFDAFAFGNTIAGPETFYQYARGQSVPHPGGYTVRITKPPDWGAVTDHAGYLGLIQEAADPTSPLRQRSPWLAEILEFGAEKDPMLAFKALSVTIAKGHALKDLTDPAVAAPVWKRMVEIADRYYQPGKFTTFAAYEWTSSPNALNLHRNILPRLAEGPVDAVHSHRLDRPARALALDGRPAPRRQQCGGGAHRQQAVRVRHAAVMPARSPAS